MNDDILEKLGIKHTHRETQFNDKTLRIERKCPPDCPACAVLKSLPIIRAEGRQQMIDWAKKNKKVLSNVMFNNVCLGMLEGDMDRVDEGIDFMVKALEKELEESDKPS